MYLIENKSINRNTATLVVELAAQTDKIDHQNIALGGDFTRQLGITGLQVLPCPRANCGRRVPVTPCKHRGTFAVPRLARHSSTSPESLAALLADSRRAPFPDQPAGVRGTDSIFWRVLFEALKLTQSQAGRPHDDRLQIARLELHSSIDHRDTDVSSTRVALIEQLAAAITSVGEDRTVTTSGQPCSTWRGCLPRASLWCER